jgi:hypothetical protein
VFSFAAVLQEAMHAARFADLIVSHITISGGNILILPMIVNVYWQNHE